MKNIKNIKIIKPLNYYETLQILKYTDLILSDSGGLQEEASVLNKKILILREKTERPEILGKNGKLVGHNINKIISMFNYIMNKKINYSKFSVYGDGNSSEKIKNIIIKKI